MSFNHLSASSPDFRVLCCPDVAPAGLIACCDALFQDIFRLYANKAKIFPCLSDTVALMSVRRSISEAKLDTLQRETFEYFVREANPANGLILDKTEANSPASIAATGLALAAYPIGVERGFWTRSAAAERTLATLRFFWNSPHGPEADATGYRGFYYHFLDMQTGRRVWDCELSTVDSAFLLAGALIAAAYFDAERPRKGKSANSPTRSTDDATGHGHRTESHCDAWLAARKRVHPLSMGRL
jgi:hypothetical protein